MVNAELLGRLGGAEVEVIPVEAVASGSSGSAEILASVDVQDGETWLIAVSGNMVNGNSLASNFPELRIGDTSASCKGKCGMAELVTSSAQVKLARNTSNRTDTFVGHVYTVKI